MLQPELRNYIVDAVKNRRKLLSIFLTCGFPRREWTVDIAKCAFENGADFVELGMPFSDPMADGPSIQTASHSALSAGITTADLFDTASQLVRHGRVLYMGYMNNLISQNPAEFLRRASHAGISGFIIPDWPIEAPPEMEIEQQFKIFDMPRIPFIAPTSTQKRIQAIDALNVPFIYAVSITGVTGARQNVSDATIAYLQRLRSQLHTPFLIGFGISSPENAHDVIPYSDGVIIGSAILNGIASAKSVNEATKFVGEFVRSVRDVLDASPQHETRGLKTC